MGPLTLQELKTQNPPIPRSGHVAVPLPPGKANDVLVFGGYVEHSPQNRVCTNEAYTFSRRTSEWQAVKWAAGPVPQARLVSQAVMVGSHMYLIAGWDSGQPGTGGTILSDVWRCDLGADEWRWEEVALQGEALQPISRFQAVAVGDKIWIHTHRSVDDILLLDTATQPHTLSKVRVHGPSPSARGLHSLTHIAGRLWLFGGAAQSGAMAGDLWSLDLATLTWAQHKLPSDLGGVAPPQPRCSHLALAEQDRFLVIIGGAHTEAGGLQGLNDVHAFDTQSDMWFPVAKPQGTLPPPRNASALVSLPVTTDAAAAAAVAGGGTQREYFIFGGWQPFKVSYNDSFIVKFELP